MSKKQDHIQDIAEIRSMMERSSKFLSLSGLSGVLAGFYALTGVYLAYSLYGFRPTEIITNKQASDFSEVVVIALLVLILAIGTAVTFSYRRATSKGEKIWNSTSRRLLVNVSVPLVAGAGLALVLFSKGFVGLIPSITLLFYGLALFTGGSFTFNEIKFLGVIQILLGLIAAYFVEYALIFWAVGFGFTHIIYGIYIHIRHKQ